MILTKHSVVSPRSSRKQTHWQSLRCVVALFVLMPLSYRDSMGHAAAVSCLKVLSDGQGFLISDTSHTHSLVAPAHSDIYILRGQSLQSLRRRWWRVLVAKQMFCNAISQVKTYGGRESSKAATGWRTNVGGEHRRLAIWVLMFLTKYIYLRVKKDAFHYLVIVSLRERDI